MISRPCWRCGRQVGEGYQIEFRLVSPNRPPSPPYVTANVCWPCIRPVNEALGERVNATDTATR